MFGRYAPNVFVFWWHRQIYFRCICGFDVRWKVHIYVRSLHRTKRKEEEEEQQQQLHVENCIMVSNILWDAQKNFIRHKPKSQNTEKNTNYYDADANSDVICVCSHFLISTLVWWEGTNEEAQLKEREKVCPNIFVNERVSLKSTVNFAIS